jgi:arachidonate 5-lipoxygenase
MQNLFGFCYEKFNFASINPCNDLKRRGLLSLKDNEMQVIDGYEYGRDALRLWSCLRKFNASIIETEYNNGNSVKNDASLHSWAEYIKDVGLMRTFPDICTNLDLNNIVTSIVFQLSVQHSAVNYTQSYFYGFTRNAPPCIYNWDTLTDWQSQIDDKLFDIIPKKTLLERRIHMLLSIPPSKEETFVGIIE